MLSPKTSRPLWMRATSYLLLCSISLSIFQCSSARASGTTAADGLDVCHNPESSCGECPPDACSSEGQNSDGAPASDMSVRPVHFSLNSAVERVVDLRLPGVKFGWSHKRSYDSRMARGTGDFASIEGVRWHGTATESYLRYVKDSTDLQLYVNATNKRIFKYNSSKGVYEAPESPVVIVKTGSGTFDELYTATNTETGEVAVYYGLIWFLYQYQGRLYERTTRAFQEASLPGTRYGYRTNGTVDWVLTPQGSLVDYSYYTGDDDTDRLKSIAVYSGSTSSTTLLQFAEYMYYDTVLDSTGNSATPSTDLGATGDLVQVKTRKRASSDAGNNPTNLTITRTTQYRYWASAENSHQIKMVLESDAIERLIQNNSNFAAPEDILAEADTYSTGSTGSHQLQEFASRSFVHYEDDVLDPMWSGESNAEDLVGKYGGVSEVTYLTDKGTWDGCVKSETINGSCTSCSGTSGTDIRKEYYYLQVDWWYGIPISDINPNKVVRIVIEDTIDATNTPRFRRLYGINNRGTAIREVFLEDPVNPSANNIWCKSIVFEDVDPTSAEEWRVTQRRMPSAHAGKIFDNETLKEFLNPTGTTNSESNDTRTVNDDSGVVYHFEYDNTDGLRPTGKLVSNGTTQQKHYISATDYGDGDGDGVGQDEAEGKLPIARYDYSVETTVAGRSSGNKISFAYSFWDGDDTAIRTKMTTLPAIASSENGSGSETKTYEFYDQAGRLRWSKDGEGYVTYYSYHPNTGALALRVDDVDTDSLSSDITGTGSGKWVAWSGAIPSENPMDDYDGDYDFNRGDATGYGGGLPTPLQLVTKNEFDEQGRIVKTISPGGDEHHTYYFADGTVHLPYVDGSGDPQLPAQVVKTNDAGVVLETYSVDPSTVNTSLTGLPTASSNYVTWTVNSYDPIHGRLSRTDRYHDIDASTTGEGTDKQYFGTRYLYDELGRRAATVQYVDAGKYQVSANLFDLMDRVVETRRGVATSAPTDSSDLSQDPIGTPTGFPSGGYAIVSQSVYDEGSVGDGHLTQTKSYYDTSDFVETNYHRTWRGHVRGIDRKNNTTAFGPYPAMDVDWKGRTVATAQYSVVPSSWPTGYTNYVHDPTANSGIGGPTGSNFFDTKITKYDALGRVYQSLRFPGVQAAKHFEVNNYYDRNGRLACTGDKYSAHTEYAYDGAGRQYQSRTVMNVSSSSPYSSGVFVYNEPQPDPEFAIGSNWDGTLAGDGDEGVIEITHTVYNASGNATEQHAFELNHNDSDGIDIDDTASFVRRSVYSWYDDADRLEVMANYGAGDGNPASADSWKYTALPGTFPTKPTVSTAAVLGTKYGYHTATGRQDTVTSWQTASIPVVTKTFHDDMGWRLFVVENHLSTYDPTSSIGSVTAGENRTTGWEYNGLGQTTLLTAYNNSSSTGNQETQYLYEDPFNASLVTNTIYPDSSDTTSSGTDQVKRTYNLDGSLASMTDQRGVEHVYYYNNRRQLELDAVETLNGVDGYVESIKRTYDTLGRLKHIISYDDAAGTGTARNGIYYTYSTVTGNIYASHQNHAGVGSGSDPRIEYHSHQERDSDEVFENALRLARIKYPNGAWLGFERGHTSYWGDSNSLDDRLHRISGLDWDADASGTIANKELVDYSHNGTSRLAKIDYPLPDVKREMFGSSANDYESWDRFGRTLSQQWSDYTGGTAIRDQVDYTYDYAGNRLTRDVNGSSSSTFDQEYTYDGLHRLLSSDENPSSSTKDRYWQLDQLGNWEKLYHNLTGTGSAAEDRTHNDANELTYIDATEDEFGPSFDLAGNATSLPKSVDLSEEGYTLKYDAWNRLVEVKAGSTVVQTNEYDGLNRRIVRDETNGASGEVRHYYYNQQWQVIEERVGSSTSADKQYVYHPHYVDAVAMRYDASSTDEHYYLQDANFNVTAVVDETGAVEERYTYTPYGEVTVLDDVYAAVSGNVSAISNELLYTGRRLDPETGLQLNRNRFYASHLGRWVNRDPILYWGGFNLYEYTGSMPTFFVDPDGTDFWVENGEQVGGLHRRICVDVCDKNGNKTGKYCVSFGVDGQGEDPGSIGSPGVGGGGGGGGGPDIPGIDDNPNGSGVVYPDTGPTATNPANKDGKISPKETTCCEDKKIKDYLESLVDQRGDYDLIGGSCRNFSASCHTKINKWRRERRKKGITN